MRFEHNIEIHQNSLIFVIVASPTHLLDRNDGSTFLVTHFDDVTAGSVAQIAKQLQIVDFGAVLFAVDQHPAGLTHDLLQFSFLLLIAGCQSESVAAMGGGEG